MTLPVLGKHTAVIQIRCEAETVLNHHLFGPTEYSFYNAIPKDVTEIIIVSMPTTKKFCHQHVESLQRYFKEFRPEAVVKTQSSNEILYDLATLMLAPTLLYQSFSTFGIMGAIGNPNRVITTQGGTRLAGKANIEVDTVATSIVPSVAKKLNIFTPDDLLMYLEEKANMTYRTPGLSKKTEAPKTNPNGPLTSR